MNEPQHVIVDSSPTPQHVTVDLGRKVRFDPTINLGHVASLLAFLIAAAAAWSTIDKRVVVLEEARKMQIERDAQQDLNLKDRLGELQRGLDAIYRSVEKLSDRLESKK